MEWVTGILGMFLGIGLLCLLIGFPIWIYTVVERFLRAYENKSKK